MLRRFVLAAWLLTAPFAASAFDYTDAWYTLGETGWGTFLVQSDTFQFIAFFIYDNNGNPTWYSGQLTVDAAGNYSGLLYASTGSPFASPWNPAQQHTNPVGTISFVPADHYHATLTYSITGGPTVIKQIQRFTLIPAPVDGTYSGSMAGSISGCANPMANDPAFRGRYNLVASQVADQSATLTFTFVDNTHAGLVCTITGPLTHFGRLYQLNSQTTCTGPGQDGAPHAGTVEALHRVEKGMEGHLTGSASGGCAVSLHFEAVLDVNN